MSLKIVSKFYTGRFLMIWVTCAFLVFISACDGNNMHSPAARFNHAAVRFQGQDWILGGATEDLNVLSDIWTSPDSLSWQQVTASAPWGPRSGFGCVIFGEKMFIVGGRSGGGAESMDIYDDVWCSSDGTNWSLLVSGLPWGKRKGFSCVTYQNRIYVIGGRSDSGTYLADVWASNDGKNWENVLDRAPWEARSNACAVVLKDRLYLYGGLSLSDHLKEQSDVWMSSDGTNWSLLASAPWSPRYGSGCTVYKDEIWLLGGVSFFGPAKDDVWSSSDGISWKQYDTKGTFFARSDFGTIAVDNGIRISGGIALDHQGGNHTFYRDLLGTTDGNIWSRIWDN